jgi:IS5 family transposase
MKRKNNDLDRWGSSVRAPFEGVFSKFEKRARYRGHAKVQFQFFMDAIVHNVKRLVAIHAPPLFQGA